jgi:anaerobic selenocysteine-containing dehydrogenase
MKSREEFLTFCHLCCGRCSRKATVEDGRVVDWDRDLESGLPTEWCPTKKGSFVPEILHHPDRLKYPQKRVGAKGEGKWEQISWDEALDTIAEKFKEIKEKYGPEYVAFGLGEPKGMEFAFAQRFATAFGTPNVATPGHICGSSASGASAFTLGTGCIIDEKNYPRLLVLWGSNLIHTSASMRRESLREALIKGMKLIVIDPKQIDIAKRADLWIRPRPGSDGALALGVLKIIIEENLYDKDFVAKWTVGFDELAKHIKCFSLEDAEKATWVPMRQILEFARMYAGNHPSSLKAGNGVDGTVNAFQTYRAIVILRAITGNLNIRGGDVFVTPAPFTKIGRFLLLKELPRDKKKALGNEFKWAMRDNYIPYQAMIKAIIEEKQYPIKAVFFILSNPLQSYPNAFEVFQALMKLEFMVVSEIFMTPTAALADIVLPAATGAEHDALGYWPGWYGDIRAYPKLVDPPGECWPDAKMINELAKKLGLGKYFWNNEKEALDEMLKPSGLSYEEFKQKRILQAKTEYKKMEEGVLATPSKKVEIYSNRLIELGYSPIPRWEEVSHDLYKISDEYPLLLTNAKEEAYVGSGYRHITGLRNLKSGPVVEVHPETARKYHLKEGEWIFIETRKGKIKQELRVDSTLDPRVVFVSFGWWFPEKTPGLYGWEEANLNILTESGPPYDSITGGVQIRGIPCKIYKA